MNPAMAIVRSTIRGIHMFMLAVLGMLMIMHTITFSGMAATPVPLPPLQPQTATDADVERPAATMVPHILRDH